MACTFVGVKGDFWKKKSPIRLPKAHAILKEKSYLPFHPLGETVRVGPSGLLILLYSV